SEQSPFPGWRAIAPTLGTALLILAGQRRNLSIPRLLSLKPVVAIGLISYSAYLWHWPVLAFYRYGYGDVTLFSGAVIFALTMMLSWASYRWVEVPSRRSKAP